MLSPVKPPLLVCIINVVTCQTSVNLHTSLDFRRSLSFFRCNDDDDDDDDGTDDQLDGSYNDGQIAELLQALKPALLMLHLIVIKYVLRLPCWKSLMKECDYF